jgi:hypothetical protein
MALFSSHWKDFLLLNPACSRRTSAHATLNSTAASKLQGVLDALNKF